MKNPSQSGQVMIFSAVLLPALLIAAGVVIRASQTAFVYHRVQHHIDQRALDALRIQGAGLEALGELNPYAATIIDTRRAIQKAQAVAAASIEGIPAAAKLQVIVQKLMAAQKMISLKQNAIKVKTLTESLETLTKGLPSDLRNKVQLSYSPKLLMAPHQQKESLLLHVDKKSGYQTETGAPVELDKDFKDRQKIEIEAKVRTEAFLPFWRTSNSTNFNKLPEMKIKTLARVEMEDLESKWKVQIREVGKPSSN